VPYFTTAAASLAAARAIEALRGHALEVARSNPIIPPPKANFPHNLPQMRASDTRAGAGFEKKRV
jgi:hypothetical protein